MFINQRFGLAKRRVDGEPVDDLGGDRAIDGLSFFFRHPRAGRIEKLAGRPS